MCRPTLESLEARNCPATLNIVSGALYYIGTNNEDNNLVVTYNAGSYGFRDTGALITLGDGALGAGWRGSGTNTVTGSALPVDSINVTVGDGTNVVNVRQIVDPATIDGGSGHTTINVNSLAPTTIGSLAGIQADLTVNPGADTTLNVSDYGGLSRPDPVVIDATGLSGLSAHAINFGTGTFASLRVQGSNSATLAETFDVGDLSAIASYFRLDTNGGPDAVTVAGNVTGDVYLGGGDDTLTILSGFMLTGSVHTGGQAGDVVNYGEPAFGTITGSVGP